jgi:hypothetical protein
MTRATTAFATGLATRSRPPDSGGFFIHERLRANFARKAGIPAPGWLWSLENSINWPRRSANCPGPWHGKRDPSHAKAAYRARLPQGGTASPSPRPERRDRQEATTLVSTGDPPRDQRRPQHRRDRRRPRPATRHWTHPPSRRRRPRQPSRRTHGPPGNPRDLRQPPQMGAVPASPGAAPTPTPQVRVLARHSPRHRPLVSSGQRSKTPTNRDIRHHADMPVRSSMGRVARRRLRIDEPTATVIEELQARGSTIDGNYESQSPHLPS